MPLIALQCEQGHSSECFVHAMEDVGSETRLCPCGATYGPIPGYPQVQRFFSEKSPRRIMNIDGGKTEIRSTAQHEALMKAKGLSYACDWHVSRRPSRM